MIVEEPNAGRDDHLAELLQRLCEAEESDVLGDIESQIDELSETELADLIAAGHCVELLHKFHGATTVGGQHSATMPTLSLSNSNTRVDEEQPTKAPSALNQLPQSVGRFEIVQPIAKGGFAEIFKALDPAIGRYVALKIPFPHLLQDEAARIRFQREATAVGLLSHPGIVPVYEAGSDAGRTYIALEWISGTNLREFLRSSTNDLTPTHVAIAVSKLAEAVGHAHHRGILHRDLKPANVLLENKSNQPWFESLKVTDFGLAKIVDEGASLAEVTADGMLLGTPAYMAPEQIEGQPCPATDVYALGTMMYEMLTGVPPHKQETYSATIRSIESRTIPSLQKVNRQVPADLASICHKCLEKDPNQRYQNAVELYADLDRYLRGMPIVARRPSWRDHFKKWILRNPVLATSLFLTATTLVGAVITIGMANQKAKKSSAEFQIQLGNMQSMLEDLNEDLQVAEDFELREQLGERLIDCSSQILDSSSNAETTSELVATLGQTLTSLGYPVEAEKILAGGMSRMKTLGGSRDDLLRLQVQHTNALVDRKAALQTWDRIVNDVTASEKIAPKSKLVALFGQAETAMLTGQLDRAEQLYSDYPAWLDKLEIDPETAMKDRSMAKVRLAWVKYLKKPGRDGLKPLRDAIDQFAEGFPKGHSTVAIVQKDMMNAYCQNGKHEDARALAESVFGLTQKRYGLANLSTLLAADGILIACGRTINRKGSRERLAEIVSVIDENLPLVSKRQHASREPVLAMLANLAMAHNLLGDKPKEVAVRTELVSSLTNELGRESIRTQQQLLKLAIALESIGEYDKAIECFDEVLSVAEHAKNESKECLSDFQLNSAHVVRMKAAMFGGAKKN